MLQNSDIIKGSKLMVFVGAQTPVAFATNNSLNMTTNTTQVSTKDHGDYPATIAQNITWEVTSENLYSYDGEKTFIKLQMDKTPVTLKFVDASNYSNTDEKGIVGHQGTAHNDNWTAGVQGVQGQALVTSFSVNAPAGDNATMSVTFTGTGDLTALNLPAGTQGTQGA